MGDCSWSVSSGKQAGSSHCFSSFTAPSYNVTCCCCSVPLFPAAYCSFIVQFYCSSLGMLCSPTVYSENKLNHDWAVTCCWDSSKLQTRNHCEIQNMGSVTGKHPGSVMSGVLWHLTQREVLQECSCFTLWDEQFCIWWPLPPQPSEMDCHVDFSKAFWSLSQINKHTVHHLCLLLAANRNMRFGNIHSFCILGGHVHRSCQVNSVCVT